eukprot:469241-Hanusia_phi.AAC.1
MAASRLRTLRVARHDVSAAWQCFQCGSAGSPPGQQIRQHPIIGGSLSGPGCGRPEHSPGAAGLQAQGPGRCPHGWTL